AYFTGTDPASLVAARAARRLVVAARRALALRAAGVVPDVVVGSVSDPRENAPRSAYAPPPGALVLTDGPRPIRAETDAGVAWVEPPGVARPIAGDYGAGDSFAAALTFHLGSGLAVVEACARAAPHGAAVLAALDPREAQERLVAVPAVPRPRAVG